MVGAKATADGRGIVRRCLASGLTLGMAWERVECRPACALRQEDVAVSRRTRTMLAAALGLWMAHQVPAQEPGPFTVERGQTLASQPTASVHQQLANTVATQLRQSGQIRDYTVDLVVHQGTVEVSGTVADQPQREEVLRI